MGFQSTTGTALITDILALTDEDGYGRIGNDLLVSWINNELTTLWQWASRINRDFFTKVSNTLTVPAGQNYYSMTAAGPTGAGITDWKGPRGVEVQIATNTWKRLPMWKFTTRDRTGMLAYRFLGETLWLYPIDQAQSYPLRVWYLFDAPQVTVGTLGASISLPDGADEYVKQGAAAKVRVRLQDDPTPHLAAQAQVREQVESDLKVSRGGQQAIADTMEDQGPELWF